MRLHQVDSFTDKPFSGNPAGVCILEKAADETWMQNVAREMNLSETAFLVPAAEGGYNLRWFTPALEVDLCGHATLASAHILWQTGVLKSTEQARFHTRSGLLTANRAGDWIELNFPATAPKATAPAPGLLEALGTEALWVGMSRFDYFVEVGSEKIVRELDPDISGLQRAKTRGVIVTAPATTPGFDFISRFFAPGAGVPEDPATGSSHCALAPYWQKKLGKDAMLAYQASKRGGTLRVRCEGDRVILGGQAVTVMDIELL